VSAKSLATIAVPKFSYSSLGNSKWLGVAIQAPQFLAKPQNLFVSISKSGAKRNQAALQKVALL